MKNTKPCKKFINLNQLLFKYLQRTPLFNGH